MQIIKLKFSQLLYNSVHIGHPISYSTTFATWYVYGIRYTTLLLSLSKIVFFWKKGSLALIKLASNFGSVLLVNLEPSLNYIFYRMSKLTQQPMLLNKWRGGLLTNWKFVFLRKIPSFKKNGFKGTWSEEFMKNLRMSTRLPTAVASFNMVGDFLAFQEAQTVNIPIFALADSNLNTSNILYPLPGNDDAVSSITFCSFIVSKSIILGRLSGISKYSKVKKMFNYS